MWNASRVALLLLCALLARGERLEFVEPHMGTLFGITVYGDGPVAARAAANAAFARVTALDEALSDYKPESELNRLTRHAPGEWVAVSRDLFVVLEEALRLSRDSGGAFDVTAGPVIRLWRAARRSGVLPSREALAEALGRSGFRHVQLDAGRRAVRFDIAGLQLDFGAIAKGYAADEALAVLRARGFRRAMVAASGDLALGDAPPGSKGWKIRVEPSEGSSRVLVVRNAGVSTSGDRNQFVEIGGVRYSHIVDARMGMALTGRRGVSVVARRAIDADGLATAAFVLGRRVKGRRARVYWD